jgi:hypothetical protein
MKSIADMHLSLSLPLIMIKIKNISFCLIFSFAVFCCLGKGIFFLFQDNNITIEYTLDQSSGTNTITISSDVSDDDVKYDIPSGSFPLSTQSIEKVIPANIRFPHNLARCIWLPPKVS